jgi:CysZ protein
MGASLLHALFLGFRQLADRSSRRVLLRCLLVASLTFVLLVAAVAVVLATLDPTGLAWLDAGIAIAGFAAALVLTWLLFPVVIAAALGFFAEDVVEAVERRYYPDLPPPQGMGVGESAWVTLRFTAVALLLNLLALPLYLVPGVNLLIYLALNGYLLGREYIELVALRRLPGPTVAALRRRLRARFWLAGVVIAALLAVPGFNLVAPVVAIAFAVHLFEGLRRDRNLVPGYGMSSRSARVAAARRAGNGSV